MGSWSVSKLAGEREGLLALPLVAFLCERFDFDGGPTLTLAVLSDED